MGPYLIAIPYTTDSTQTGPYIGANQGVSNAFVEPANAPGGRIGAVVGQFLMVGDILQSQTQQIGTGNGTLTTFAGSLFNTPMLATGAVYDQAGTLSGSFSNGLIAGSGLAQTSGLPGQFYSLADYYFVPRTGPHIFSYSQFSLKLANNPGQNAFTALVSNGVTLTTASATYLYSAGIATWKWTTPFNYGTNAVYPTTFTGTTYTTTITAGYRRSGFYDIFGYDLTNGVGTVKTTALSTVNYETGAINLVCSTAPPSGNAIYAVYTQAAPYRVQWSAIGDPTNLPIPLTANAIAYQSGYQDMEADLGPVKFIAGYPLYGIIFQEFGISRANYVGGNVVWSFGTFSKNRGLVAKGAACQVGLLVYFLSQDGFFVTDGNSVSPIGTDDANDLGIDQTFWDYVNQNALENIRCGYDSGSRCVYWSIPVSGDTLPNILLIYNPQANRWTKATILSECVWTDNNGSTVPGNQFNLGLFTQGHQYTNLTGPQLAGYLETCDIMATDGMKRFTTGIRPNLACNDTPQAVLGTRDSLQDNINYTTPASPDPFSRIVPVMGEGIYTRVRVSTAAGTNIVGATLDQQVTSPI